MQIRKEQLQKLQEILQKEYDSYLSEESLSTEALRLFEFAKTVFRFSLSKKNEKIIS